MISARTRRIAIVSFAVIAAGMLVVRLYRWVSPASPRASAYRGGQSDTESGRQSFFCTDVRDGDTIVVQRLGQVRLIGIDTPEMNYETGEPQALALEAKEFCRRMVSRRDVTLEFDRVKRDKYGRVLAYVFAGDRFVNADLIEAGLARAYHIPPNDRYKNEFRRLELAARDAKRGIWGLND